MRAHERSSLLRPVLVLTLATLPAPSHAQVCTARVDPSEVAAGSPATPVRVTVSAPIGAVTGVDASPASGISLAFPDDLPPAEPAEVAASIGGAPRTIEMGESENVWIVWLSVDERGRGAHRVTFTAREGRCGAQLKVRPAR